MGIRERIKRVWRRGAPALERGLRAVPTVNRRLEARYEEMLVPLEASLKPYRGDYPAYSRLPEQGRDRAAILGEIEELKEREEARWRDGFVSGAVYHGDAEHIDFLNRVYALTSQSNPLHADVWPSAAKYEAEIVAMTADMLGGSHAAAGEPVCGTVSSGGTESILLAMKTYRDRARAERGITRPEMVVPISAHAAFDKAADYFGIKMVRVPLDGDYRADVAAARRAITRNTIVMVGSAPCFPYGVIDPIEKLSALAQSRGIGFHTDACLGGFVLPWAADLGYAVPPFDFRLPGVTSMSADTHKYGYAAKGTSVVLYRGPALRRYQYFTATDWPGGLYFSPTFAGSRPGALSAACWAALVSLGRDGYREATRRILLTADEIRQGIAATPGLRLLGHSLFVHAFTSDEVDIYRVLEAMSRRGWSLNGLHRPACVHICVTLRHTQPGIGHTPSVAQRFVADLRAAVEEVRAHPNEKGEMAPVYGLAASLPLRGVVSDILERYVDTLYKV
ncbi:MAG: aminotransferase class V-fold PLP-dependent enzyme [Candidatus Promineofilum sp.]|nr:aminotransferase class V-fold PLP-dependent enzyme [Promineifilum sp.]